MKIELGKFEKALQSLKMAIYPPPANDRERDGAIQRFEYTFEAAWKAGQKTLRNSGIDAASPRDVIREMGRLDWIASVEEWFDFLDKRNQTSHTYNQETAEAVWSVVPKFHQAASKLLNRLGKP